MTKCLKSSRRASCYFLSTIALCMLSYAAQAQAISPQPFDMAPETGQTGKPPVQVLKTPDTEHLQATPPAVNVTPAMKNTGAAWRRYLVPAEILPLTGESYRRSWNIALTEQEAKAPARLNIGYQSAILVAPESSEFVVSINNVDLLHQQIRAVDQPAQVMVDVPAGLLRSGANTFSIRAQQRHRTDCTIESTYELWTNIDPAKTYLAFDLQAATGSQAYAARFAGNEDIASIGVNAKGNTQFHIVAPALGNGSNGTSLLDLSQALAILGGMPNQSFSVDRTLDPALIHKDGAQSGELTVLVGTQAELAPVFNNLQLLVPEANTAPASPHFIAHKQTGEQFLLITGSNWREIEEQIAHLVAMTERPVNTKRQSLHTQNWNLPDAQLLRGATSLSFAQLGIPTQQFSGRRLRNQFTFAVPADFYANAYGSATVFLDAAYSAEVSPGSHINIYVNDNIATTIPITNQGGGVMRQLPIRVAMRHFRPGLNKVIIEAALMSEADEACMVGAAASSVPRFALFDTSQFSMPDFGRIGQVPNLAATAGMAYPYTYTPDQMALYANLGDYNVLSASATILGNLANAAGRPLNVNYAPAANVLKSGNALFVGAVTNLPDAVLLQTGLAPETKNIWSDDDSPQADAGLAETETNFTLNQWQEKLQSGWYARLQSFYNRVAETFRITDSLRLFPAPDEPYIPSPDISVLMAQSANPAATGAWTVVTAPDVVMLRQGAEQLAHQTSWTKAGGRLSAYNSEKQTIETLPARNIEFLNTQPFSLTNARLVMTNWLSSNALSYVVVMLISLVALGLSTSFLLSRSGRRDDDN